jgi:prephenate dehydrogenase
MSIQLTVIGLNRIGVSVGLALKDNPHDMIRIGTDPSQSAEQKALKMGAFDKVIHAIPAAVEDADIVLLSLPMDELREYLEMIAPALKAGAVILDTSPLAVAVSSWIDGLFPEERYFVSFTPSLNPAHITGEEVGVDQASADLFKNSLFAISAPASVHPGALQLASDLAGLLGAQSYFTDPYEADGLIALVDLLPKLSAAALLGAATKQPGWREARKLAGHAFFAATEAVNHFDEQKELGAAALLNPENTVRLLNDLISELISLRDMLNNQDADELKKTLNAAVEARQQWWRQRQKSDWEGREEEPPLITRREIFGRYLGFGRRSKDKQAGK